MCSRMSTGVSHMTKDPYELGEDVDGVYPYDSSAESWAQLASSRERLALPCTVGD